MKPGRLLQTAGSLGICTMMNHRVTMIQISPEIMTLLQAATARPEDYTHQFASP